jgi:peptidoglycan/xylan/chitin deacetylase (PgdA/CDA1 family)
MKTVIFWIAKYTGIFALCRLLTKKQVRILAYHGIWLGEGHYGNFLYISATKFSERMKKIQAMGLPVLSLDDALNNRGKAALPACPVVITIDDGWYSTYLHMLPALEKYNFPATLYLTTYYSEKQMPVYNVLIHYLLMTTTEATLDMGALGVSGNEVIDLSNVDQRQKTSIKLQSIVDDLDAGARDSLVCQIATLLGIGYKKIINDKWFHLVSIDQVSDMVNRGVDVQLHTHRHRISFEGIDCLEQELMDNRLRLEPLVAQPLKHFCYPSGVYDEAVWPSLKAKGITSATTTESGLVNSRSHIFALPRILDGEQVSDLEFEAELSGVGEVKRRLASFLN